MPFEITGSDSRRVKSSAHEKHPDVAIWKVSFETTNENEEHVSCGFEEGDGHKDKCTAYRRTY